MNKLLLSILIGAACVGLVPAFASNDNFCLDEMNKGIQCFSYEQAPNHIPSTSQHPPLETSKPIFQSLNWVMDVHAPNHTCNITGVTLSNGDCSAPSIVLSDDDFNTFKTNVSVLAVEHIQNSAMPAQDYCPVAIWTWGTQSDAFHQKYNMTYVIPQRCLPPQPPTPTPIPDFTSSVALAVFLIMIISAIAITTKYGHKI